MSQYRNISDDARTVVYGVTRPIEVAPDGVVTVDDDVDESYLHQTSIWKPVDGPAVDMLAAKLAADQAQVDADQAAIAAIEPVAVEAPPAPVEAPPAAVADPEPPAS